MYFEFKPFTYKIEIINTRWRAIVYLTISAAFAIADTSYVKEINVLDSQFRGVCKPLREYQHECGTHFYWPLQWTVHLLWLVRLYELTAY